MKTLYCRLALFLVAVGASSTSFCADDGKSTRSRIKRPSHTKAKNSGGLKAIEKHAMEVEAAQENQEAKNFEQMLHVFESYVQRLSEAPFEEHDFKALHDAFHALTSTQKENFLRQFPEKKVATHIIEKLKLLYEQFPKPHHG